MFFDGIKIFSFSLASQDGEGALFSTLKTLHSEMDVLTLRT